MAKHTFTKGKKIEKMEVPKPKNEFSMNKISKKNDYTSIRVKKDTASLWGALAWVLDKSSIDSLMKEIGGRIYEDFSEENKMMFDLYLKKKEKK